MNDDKSKEPIALNLAKSCELHAASLDGGVMSTFMELVAAALRWQHARIEVLEAGDVGQLRKEAPAAVAVPEGWALVPERATKAMQDAWDTAPFDEDTDKEFLGAYAAMIASAPAAPAQQDAQDAARLDFLEGAVVGAIRMDDRTGLLPSYIYWGQYDQRRTAREAIDAAMAARKAGGE